VSLSPLVSFKSRFATYLLNFPRNTYKNNAWECAPVVRTRREV